MVGHTSVVESSPEIGFSVDAKSVLLDHCCLREGTWWNPICWKSFNFRVSLLWVVLVLVKAKDKQETNLVLSLLGTSNINLKLMDHLRRFFLPMSY
jgi:hypothetical protein